MEQQTISITKAGIQATLNARTAILAAANPIYGRYDTSRSLRQNINISAPIMSRFDLFFIVLDELDELRDESIAKHIIQVHQKREAALTDVPYPMDKILNYVRFARSISPQLSTEAKRTIVKFYERLRQADALAASQSAYRVTVRQLESMIRLSEALARLHLDTEVSARYVVEAYALIRKSMKRIDIGDLEFDLDDEDVGNRATLFEGYRPERPVTAADDGMGMFGEGGGEATQEPEEGTGAGAPNSPARPTISAEEALAAKKSKRIQITASKFEHIKRSLAWKLREQEMADSEAAASGEDTRTDDERELEGAVTEGDLIIYYLTNHGANLEGEEALKTERKTLRKVIAKLVSDRILYYPIRSQVDGTTQTEPDARWIKLDPDFVITGFDHTLADDL
jgi:DNA replication licensing factor MCM6